MTLIGVSQTPRREFGVWAGSTIGREHVRLGRNNQDAAAFSVESGTVVAVVADGCSSARASEVGAKLGAEWIAANGGRLLKKMRGLAPRAVAEGFVRALLRYLGSVVAELPPSALGDMFLFTLLVAVIERDRAFVFGIGDGAVVLNGRLTAREDTAPAYVVYRLAEALDLSPETLRPVLHWIGAPKEIDSLLIATDGLLDVDPPALTGLIGDPAYLFNASLLHKKLAAISDRTRKIFDDTTCVLIRRL